MTEKTRESLSRRVSWTISPSDRAKESRRARDRGAKGSPQSLQNPSESKLPGGKK